LSKLCPPAQSAGAGPGFLLNIPRAPVVAYKAMHVFRRHQFLLSFLILLIFCSVMVIRGIQARRAKHVERREALILLYTRGYQSESKLLYERMLQEIPKLGPPELFDDFQRTLLLINPRVDDTNNLIWLYHWTVSNELEKRAQSTLERARKLANEK
jgi:hypothetical protein